MVRNIATPLGTLSPHQTFTMFVPLMLLLLSQHSSAEFGLSCNDTISEGACSNAIETMTFHRQKMTEYQCRKFLAGDQEPSRGRSLLQDSGSTHYKDWLSRSTTLEDIYRQYEQHAAEDAPVPSTSYNGYDGQVTGYAMLDNKIAPNVPEPNGYPSGPAYPNANIMPNANLMTNANLITNSNLISQGTDKGMKLNDLFHLALTAIAFLAFGTFIVEVIMCVVGMDITKQSQSVMFVQDPLEANLMRSARSTSMFLDDITSHATTTLDALKTIKADKGERLKMALCRAGIVTRSMSGVSRIWLPLWSLGMSWLGSRQGSTSLSLLTGAVRGLAGLSCGPYK